MTKKTIKATAAPATSRHRAPTRKTPQPKAAARVIPAAPVVPTPSAEQLRLEVSHRAYEMWLEGGCRHGHPNEDWLRAEQIVHAQYAL